jgi:hypothetical protein
MQNVPIDAVLLFDLHAAGMATFCCSAQKKQHPLHNSVYRRSGISTLRMLKEKFSSLAVHIKSCANEHFWKPDFPYIM